MTNTSGTSFREHVGRVATTPTREIHEADTSPYRIPPGHLLGQGRPADVVSIPRRVYDASMFASQADGMTAVTVMCDHNDLCAPRRSALFVVPAVPPLAGAANAAALRLVTEGGVVGRDGNRRRRRTPLHAVTIVDREGLSITVGECNDAARDRTY